MYDYEALLAEAVPADFPVLDDENQAAAMCYTSGTTGHPKGVVYSHRSTVLHSMGALVVDAAAVSESDRVMPVVPMFHANAWGLCQAAVMAGADLVMPGPKMQPKAIAELMEGEKVTLAAGVPTIWMGVLPELKGRDLSSLRDIVCGGSAVPQSLSEAYREQVGLPILQAWGMTETARWRPRGGSSPRCSTAPTTSWPTCAPRRGRRSRSWSCGSSTRADEELPWDGEARGELQASGRGSPAPTTTTSARADSFTEDGWLRTGDVATISPTATCGSSTAPRTWSSPAASGSPRSSSRTRSWRTPRSPRPP